MATNALVFSLISLREEKHLHKTQINNVKFFINFNIKPNEVVRLLTRNCGRRKGENRLERETLIIFLSL